MKCFTDSAIELTWPGVPVTAWASMLPSRSNTPAETSPASRTDVDASVGYYAVGLPGILHEANAIARPLMLHIAGADHFVDDDQQRQIHEGLGGHPRVTLHDYPGEDHGFAAEMGKRRSEDAARLADSRTEGFFAQHLE